MPFHPGTRSQEGHCLVSIGYILVSFITSWGRSRRLFDFFRGLLVWACTHLHAILNQVPAKLGHSPIGQGI